MISPTRPAAIDAAIDAVSAAKDGWARSPVAQRRHLLERLTKLSLLGAEEQVLAACEAKGIDPRSPTASEEWLGGPVTVLRNLRLLSSSLRALERGERPALGPSRELPSGQLVVRVFPSDLSERLLLGGFSGEVWMDPSLSSSELKGSMANAYPPAADAVGATAAVLGAGNVASIGPMDVLHEVFTEARVCVLKLNPVNEYLGPHIERSFAPLIEAGLLRLVYGGAQEGAHLVHHEGVDKVHITGSQHTHDAIVWGPDAQAQERNKTAGKPLLDKPITSELGCVTPVIIVPGDWSPKELAWQARNVASMLANNASFNCNAAKLLVTSACWPQREEFLERLKQILRELSPRLAYYPRAEERHARFTSAYADSWSSPSCSPGELPWTLATGLDPEQGQLAFREEAWCSFLAETALDGEGPDFLRAAVGFCNDHLWGNLSCTLIAQPASVAASEMARALEAAIADLRYGTVALNHWAALGYGLVSTPWGAFPGNPLEDVSSGIGFVHNTSMYGRIQKGVVRGPFIARPTPPWMVGHRSAQSVARRMARFEASGSLLHMPALAVHALRA